MVLSRGRIYGVRSLAAVSVALVVIAALIAATPSRAASEGGPLTQRCRAVSEALHGPCRGVEQGASAISALCRWAGVPDERCRLPNAPRVVGDEIDLYEQGALHRALGLQYDLSSDVGLRNAPWIGTHNSFNSAAEMGPTLSDTDANQQLSLTDQLRLDVRSLELDVHWFPSVRTGAFAPVVCHAEGNHAGCTIERPLEPVAREIGRWLRLPANRDQVVLLYIEDHMDIRAGHLAGARALSAALGRLIYRPTPRGCHALPLDLTRDDVLAAGAQVIVVSSGCGVGPAWPAVAFDWSAHEETRPVGFTDFPRCGPDYDRATYDSRLVRYFEDSTWLTAQATALGLASTDDGIQPWTAARMMRCGVDLTGLDQVVPLDSRLPGLLWSWARGEPQSGSCAIQRVDSQTPFGRWFSVPCAGERPATCRTGSGTWFVTPAPVAEADASAACTAAGGEYAVPRTGYEAQLLREAMAAGGASEAWLGYVRSGSSWTALDSRD